MRGRVIDPVKVLKLFGGKAGYQRFVRDGLSGRHKNKYYEVEDQRFPGEQGFGDKVHGREGRTHKAAHKRSMESIVRQLAKELKVSGEAARSRDRSWEVSKARTMIAYVLTRRLGYRLGEVASYCHLDMATVETLVPKVVSKVR